VLLTLKPRIVTAFEDLENILDENDENAELKESAEWTTAQELLTAVKDFIETI